MAKASLDLARAHLQATGKRVTEIRERVLARLIEAKRPLSHEELAARLAPIDKVTLYRVLDWLVAQRLTHRMTGADRIGRFAYADAGHGEHAHFECRRCSTVLCLGEVPALPLSVPRGYRLDSLELTAKGLCARCA